MNDCGELELDGLTWNRYHSDLMKLCWLLARGFCISLLTAGATGCLDSRSTEDEPLPGAAGSGASGGSTSTGGSPSTGGAAPTCDSTVQAEQTCQAGGVITAGRYWLNNNLWGQSAGTGQQCSWKSCMTGETLAWGTSWNWSGGENQVKSFASVVLGWQWGWKVQNTGLPVQVSANPTATCNWDFLITQQATNTMNVAYDLWLHSIPNPDYQDDPTDEVMVWVYRGGGAGPIGPTEMTVNVAGANWELHRGFTNWNVYSFVRTQSAPSSSLNLMDFINQLVTLGWMDPAKYLSSIQAGTEIFEGTGQLDVSAYSCSIQ